MMIAEIASQVFGVCKEAAGPGNLMDRKQGFSIFGTHAPEYAKHHI
jgi:hypothetical protein